MHRNSLKKGLFKAFSSKPYLLIWIGQTISRLGDGAFMTALSWYVIQLTGSGTAMGAMLVAYSIPRIMFLLLGGAVADRLPRQKIVFWSDIISALAIFCIPLLYLIDKLQLWHFILLSLLFGTIQGFFYPAYQAMQPKLVSEDALPSANALTSLSLYFGQLIGPIIGVGCISLLGVMGAFAFDGATFLIAALFMYPLLSSKQIPNLSKKHETNSNSLHIRETFKDLRQGLRYVSSISWLWVMICIASGANIGIFGPLQVSLPKLIQVVYHANALLLGVVEVMIACGAILGSLLIGHFSRFRYPILMVFISILISSSGIFLFGLPYSNNFFYFMACLAGILAGFGVGLFNIVWVTIIQKFVPEDKQGRVFSIDALGSFGLLPIGYGLAGVLTDIYGPAWVFIACAFFNILLVALGACIREVRSLR